MEPSPFPLQDLGDDLLIVVFKQLASISWTTLKSCSGVCHRFYKIAVPIIWSKDICINSSRNGPNYIYSYKLQRLLNPHSQLPLFVRFITLSHRFGHEFNDAEPRIIDLFKLTKNIETIIIEASYKISQRLLDEIGKHNPKSKILVAVDFSLHKSPNWRQSSTQPKEKYEYSSPQLHLLQLEGTWSADDLGLPERQRSLERIIKGCPNLRHLRKRGARLATFNDTPQELELNLDYDDVLPQLESLSYVPLSPKTLQIWGEVTRWKSIKVLKLMRLEDIRVLAQFELPLLVSLTFTAGRMVEWLNADQLDSLPRLRAPIRYLSFQNFAGAKLPHRFLGQFSDTLIEMLLQNRDRESGTGFDAAEIRMLRYSCPNLRRLGIGPRHEYDPPKWAHAEIEELSVFSNLRQLLLILPPNRGRPSPLNASICEGIHKKMHIINPSSQLMRLTVGHGFNTLDGFEALLARSNYSSTKLGSDFIVKAREKPDYGPDSFGKAANEAEKEEHRLRPFTRIYHKRLAPLLYPDHILWFAKQLGPGPSWAGDELLPKELMREEHFQQEEEPANEDLVNLAKEVVEDEDLIRQHKRFITEELEWWSRRWKLEDKYGKYWTLYDVLYPRE